MEHIAVPGVQASLQRIVELTVVFHAFWSLKFRLKPNLFVLAKYDVKIKYVKNVTTLLSLPFSEQV